MRKVYYAFQLLLLVAIGLNVWLTDLVQHGKATSTDAINAFVCLVMVFLLWSNRRSQKERDGMVAEARAKYQAMMDQWAREDAEREARWAAEDRP